MKNQLNKIFRYLTLKEGRRENVKETLRTLKVSRDNYYQNVADLEKAIVLAQMAAKETQSNLNDRLSDLVSTALSAVFPEPYSMNIEFIEKRSKTDARITVFRDGEIFDPIEETGGGVVDVVAFALRISCWLLNNPKSDPVFIMDEPFRFISSDLQDKAGLMIRELSLRLGIQFIINTHEDELKPFADRVFDFNFNPPKVHNITSGEWYA